MCSVYEGVHGALNVRGICTVHTTYEGVNGALSVRGTCMVHTTYEVRAWCTQRTRYVHGALNVRCAHKLQSPIL